MTENITVFTQNSIRITKAGRERNRVIYIDPYKMNEEPHDADFIFVTHDHYDHFSVEDMEKVAGDHTVLVIPEKMEAKAGEVSRIASRVITVKPGVFREEDGLEIETVPAYNIIRHFHPKNAEWVGYIIRVGDKRIYIAGDTDATREAKDVKCDIALVPIGGKYTMDAKKAAELVNTIRPYVAIPTHYGSIVGKQGDAEVFAQNVKEPTKVEIKIHF